MEARPQKSKTQETGYPILNKKAVHFVPFSTPTCYGDKKKKVIFFHLFNYIPFQVGVVAVFSFCICKPRKYGH